MLSRDKVYRIIDANLNRAAEGLRVLEEAVRFCMDREDLTREFKQLRHLLLSQVRDLPGKEKLIVSRSSLEDVGKKLKDEPRKEIQDIIDANFRRVEEAQRCLEEYGKLILPSWGEKFRQFRFQTYELEKRIKIKLKKIVDYTLYAITESSLPEKELIFKVQRAIKGGITVLQLREKKISTRDFLNRATKLKNMLPHNVTFIVNDRIDIALACGAEGVHLGQKDMPLHLARRIMGEDKVIGISTHSLEEAKKAEKEGADYIGVGPIFPTPTKTDAPGPVGCEIISQIKKEVKIPVVAIGGISPHNLREVLEAGADGIASISAIFVQKDVLKATENLIRMIRKFKEENANSRNEE